MTPIRPLTSRYSPAQAGVADRSISSKPTSNETTPNRKRKARELSKAGFMAGSTTSAFKTYSRSQFSISGIAGTTNPASDNQATRLEQRRHPLPIQKSLSSSKNGRNKGASMSKTGFRDSVSSETARRHSNKILETLRGMLDGAEQHGIDHIISWLPHGKAFKIHREDQFSRSILPIVTDIPSLKNFRRTLDWYGFKRIAKGKDIGAFFHPLFDRDNPSKCRKKSAAAMKACAWKNTLSEPNFYENQEGPRQLPPPESLSPPIEQSNDVTPTTSADSSFTPGNGKVG